MFTRLPQALNQWPPESTTQIIFVQPTDDPTVCVGTCKGIHFSQSDSTQFVAWGNSVLQMAEMPEYPPSPRLV